MRDHVVIIIVAPDGYTNFLVVPVRFSLACRFFVWRWWQWM